MPSGYDYYAASFSAPKVSEMTQKFVWPGISPGISPSTFTLANQPIEPENIFFNSAIPQSTLNDLTFAAI